MKTEGTGKPHRFIAYALAACAVIGIMALPPIRVDALPDTCLQEAEFNAALVALTAAAKIAPTSAAEIQQRELYLTRALTQMDAVSEGIKECMDLSIAELKLGIASGHVDLKQKQAEFNYVNRIVFHKEHIVREAIRASVSPDIEQLAQGIADIACRGFLHDLARYYISSSYQIFMRFSGPYTKPETEQFRSDLLSIISRYGDSLSFPVSGISDRTNEDLRNRVTSEFVTLTATCETYIRANVAAKLLVYGGFKPL
jgi:hypothetical protein